MRVARCSAWSQLWENGFLIFLALFLFAFAVRFVYLEQIRGSPMFSALMVDARGYDLWAQQIAAGDWLGSKVFYQAPLYPYFLGVQYAIFGHDLFWVRLVQIVLGATSCVLLASAGRSFFGFRVGVLAGTILALYPPAIFFDCLIQKSVLDLFLLTTLLVLLGKLLRNPTGSEWLLAGICLGAFALTRENALILAPVICVWLFVHFRNTQWRQKSRWIALFGAGLAVVLLPVGIRNRVVGGEFLVTTSQMGPNFYIGNHAHATGLYEPLRWGRGTPEYERQDATDLADASEGHALAPREVSRFWLQQSLDYIRRQPLQWGRLLFQKWQLTWNAVEVADSEDIGVYGEYSALLRGLRSIFHFGVLCPLAAMGMVLTWGERKRLWILYAILISIAASVALFYVFARYRFPLVPVLALFAGAALSGGWTWVRARHFAKLFPGILCLALVALAVNWPILNGYNPRADTHFNLGRTLESQGKVDEGIAEYREALRLQPDLAKAHYNLAAALFSKGNVAESVAQDREAIRSKPDFVEAYDNLGHALMVQGKIEEAIASYREAIRLQPFHERAHYNLGVALASSRRLDEAIVQFREAVRLKPDYLEARNNLGLALAAQGKFPEAAEQFTQALQIRPDYDKARFNLGLVLMAEGRPAEAIAEYSEVLRRKPDSVDALYQLGIALAKQGDVKAAIERYREILRLKPDWPPALEQLAHLSKAGDPATPAKDGGQKP